jgi:hypothetical protein
VGLERGVFLDAVGEVALSQDKNFSFGGHFQGVCLYRTNPSQPLACHSHDLNPTENAWDEDAAEGDTSYQPGGVEG